MGFRPRYKQKCAICRKGYAVISSRNQFPICKECSLRQINQPIENEKFRKLFNIDQKLYEDSSFLRDIKSKYIRFKSISAKQIAAFKEVVEELKNPKPEGKATEEKPKRKKLSN
jgi:hypothetical protein